jgi:hypothetical protein
MAKERQIVFRLDDKLYNVIKDFAAEKGYINISELLREIVIFHFMGVMLGYFKGKSIDTMMGEFVVKYKNLMIDAEKDSETEKDLNPQDNPQ